METIESLIPHCVQVKIRVIAHLYECWTAHGLDSLDGLELVGILLLVCCTINPELRCVLGY